MKWLLVFLAACTGSSNGDVVGPFTGPTHRFVVDRFSLPLTFNDAKAIADDLDGDGRPDNQLGSSFGSLNNEDNLNTHADDMIKSGAIASVVEIQADDLFNDPTVGVRFFGREGDPAIVVGGRIVDGVFTPNRTRTTDVPGRATLRLPVFADASPSVVVLDAMEIDLDPDADGNGYDARIRGGVDGDLALAETARGLIEMVDADPRAHPYMKALFDRDVDGRITPDEITENSLIESLLKPDVTLLVDGDDQQRLSFGFGVHLRPCTAGNCALGTPAQTCFDRITDGDETDIDCGGSCKPCTDGSVCTAATDCQSQSCAGTCADATCSDGVQDGYETDVDCGWNCSRCGNGFHCRRNDDCASGRCGNFGGETNVCW